MWKIFTVENKNLNEVMGEVALWKSFVFSTIDNRVKRYFAQRVVQHFDNKMLFHFKKGVHDNLMEALALAEESMKNYKILFPDIKAYLIEDDINEFYLIVSGDLLTEELYPTKANNFCFKLINDKANQIEDKKEKLEFDSWSTLIFNINLSDFYKGWIHHTPNLEERIKIQVKQILEDIHFKKNHVNYKNLIDYEKNIDQNKQYNELYNKISKVMPKIEQSLEQEWKITLINHFNEEKKKSRKIKN